MYPVHHRHRVWVVYSHRALLVLTVWDGRAAVGVVLVRVSNASAANASAANSNSAHPAALDSNTVNPSSNYSSADDFGSYNDETPHGHGCALGFGNSIAQGTQLDDLSVT